MNGKQIMNRAVAHDIVSRAIDDVRGSLATIDLTTLPSLQKTAKLADARDIVLKLYNEMLHLETVLESLDLPGCTVGAEAGTSEALQKNYEQLREIRVQQAGYLSEKYSCDNTHCLRKNNLEDLIRSLEEKLPQLKDIQSEALQAIDALTNDTSLSLKERISVKVPCRATEEDGKALDFLVHRVYQQKVHDHYTLDLNPLQYAAYLGCVPAVEKLSALFSQENAESVSLIKEYGVVALSQFSHSVEKVIPILVKYFPQQIGSLINEAIQNDDHQVINIIFNSTTENLDLPVHDILGQMLHMPYAELTSEKFIALAQKVSEPAEAEKEAEHLDGQVTELKLLEKTRDGLNISMMFDLVGWASRCGKLSDIDAERQNLLHFFCQSGHDIPLVASKFCELTKGEHCLADQQDNKGNTALHYAVKNNMVFSVKALLSKMANSNVRNNEGKTAFHLAAEEGNIELINALFFSGADPSIKDLQRRTPLDIILAIKTDAIAHNDQQRDALQEELVALDKLPQAADQDLQKGLVFALKKALIEYYHLRSKERHQSEQPKISALASKIAILKKKLKKTLASKDTLLVLSDLVGLSKLKKQRLEDQQALLKKKADFESAARTLSHYTKPVKLSDIAPPAQEKKREIKYTIFKGGGPKGTAHVGALMRAIEDNVVDPAKQIGTGGTSAGAIFSFLWALRNSKDELKDKLFKLNFMDFLDDVDRVHTNTVMGYADSIKNLCNGTASTIGKLFTLKDIPYLLDELGKHDSGLYKGDAFKEWIIDQILEKVRGTAVLDNIHVDLTPEQEKDYNLLDSDEKKAEFLLRKKAALLTFQDFKDNPDLFLQFKCFGTNISTQRGEEYSAEKTPYATLLSALRITMSLPLVFQPAYLEERRLTKVVDGRHYYRSVRVDNNPRIDGGLFDNFPVNAFDRDPKTGVELYNPETLGFCLVPPEQFDEFARNGIPQHADVSEKTFIDYLFKMVLAVMFGQQDYSHGRGIDRERTVYVSTLDVGTLDFNIDDRKKQKLVDNGGVVGMLDYEGSHGHTLEPVFLSNRTRKRLAKNGVFKEFSHNQHFSGRLEPGHLLHPVEILKLYANAEENDLKILSKLVNPNVRDEHGVTALHLAKALGFRRTYQRLVNCHANENSVTDQGVAAHSATWGQLNNLVGRVTQEQSLARLPNYVFDSQEPPETLESRFISSEKSKLRVEGEINVERLRRVEGDNRTKDTRIAELERQNALLQEELRENAQRLQPENMPLALFKRYVETHVLAKLEAAKSPVHEQRLRTAFDTMSLELRQILNEGSPLSGKARLDDLKARLVAKLNTVIQGKEPACAPLVEQGWIVFLLKGFIGTILGVATACTLFFHEGYRNTFFNGGYARDLARLRDEVNNFEQNGLRAVQEVPPQVVAMEV